MSNALPIINLAFQPGEQLPFLGPFPLSWKLPQLSGVYAVLCRQSPLRAPFLYTVIYVGQSANLAERGFPRNHHAFRRWLNVSRGMNNLFIAILPTDNLTDQERQAVEQRMIQTNNPTCNRSMNVLNLFR